jgi:tetratricopeptide (TPR) repeat protein
MVDLVSVYVRSGQTAQAESFLRSVLKDNPNNAEALVLLGSIQIVKKAPAEAERTFRTAIAKKPDDPAPYRALADLYVRERKNDAAMVAVRDGLKRQPGNFALQLLQAGLLEAKKDYDGAITVYEAMLKEAPSSLIVANNLASLLADHRTDKASLDRADALAVMLKNSQLPQFKDTLGWMRYQRQDYRAALPLLEDAAKALPNMAMVRYHLGMAYLSTGQEEKAASEFKQARTLAAGDAELLAKIDAALKSPPAKAKG